MICKCNNEMTYTIDNINKYNEVEAVHYYCCVCGRLFYEDIFSAISKYKTNESYWIEPSYLKKEKVVTPTTTTLYWNCNCDNNYIKSVELKKCKICGAQQKYQPNSRIDECIKLGIFEDAKLTEKQIQYIFYLSRTECSCSKALIDYLRNEGYQIN